MPSSGWHHTQLWLYGHWLPGDARGFRSRDHRIHSGGDYKHRPPPGEHAALRAHAAGLLTSQPITLTDSQRQLVGELIVRWFELKQTPLAAVSVGGAHCHVMSLLLTGQEDATIGKVKRYASAESTRRDASIPSRLFAGKGEPGPVTTRDHFIASYEYITEKHAREGTWIWGADDELLAKWWPPPADPGQGRGRP